MNTSKFKLKNYTTTIGWNKTVSEIEYLLVQFGATGIMKSYGEFGVVTSFSFKIIIDEREIGFKLPCKYENAELLLREQHMLVRDKQAARIQSANIAWRIVKDWIHAQLSLVVIGLAEPHEVFLPYMSNGKQTLFEVLKKQNFSMPQIETRDDYGKE